MTLSVWNINILFIGHGDDDGQDESGGNERDDQVDIKGNRQDDHGNLDATISCSSKMLKGKYIALKIDILSYISFSLKG